MPHPPPSHALAGLWLLAALSVSSAGAQQPDAAQMEQMMKKAQEMQACLQKVDPKVMEALQSKAVAMGEDIKSLCAAGKRDEAQQRAIDHGREIADSGAMQALSACGDMAKNLMAGMPQLPGGSGADGDDGNRHVCDGFR